MYTELQAVFDLSKTTYLDLITNHADTVCRQYLTLCYELKNDVIPLNKRQQLMQSVHQIRSTYNTTIEVIPSLLRDIFEVFVETHNSKQFIRKNQLLSSGQQLKVRESVLKVCAICGPDSDSGSSGKVSSKFLNLAKLSDRDYQYEGLRICVSWFEKVLEGTATSHNMGTSQALTGKLTSRGSKSASDLRRKLLDTFEEIERKVNENELVHQQVEIPVSSIGSTFSFRQLSRQPM